MSNIETNLSAIIDQRNRAARAASRDPALITIIAVSKGQTMAAIDAAYRAGQRHFGESYAQEMEAKIRESKSLGLSEIVWHFLGSIQTNKLKAIAQASMIHSLGSLKHAQALNQIIAGRMPVFLQVNLDQDQKRQGFYPTDLIKAAQEITMHAPRLFIVGLMCIAPQHEKIASDYWFNQMIQLRLEMSKHGFLHLKLSMGMSNDFQQAIAHQTDYIRIGTAIFGARNKKMP